MKNKTYETNLSVEKVICVKTSLYVVVCDGQPKKNNNSEGRAKEGGGGGGSGGGAENESSAAADHNDTTSRSFQLYKLHLESSLRDTSCTQIGRKLILRNVNLNLDKFQVDVSNEVLGPR